MDQNFLLTYFFKDRMSFAWFESEEELRLFVENNKAIEPSEAFEISNVKNIDLSKEKCIICGKDTKEKGLKVCNKCANGYKFE